MARWFKRLFIGLTTVLILITVCLLIVPTRWIANAIENVGSAALGATLTIDSLEWNPISLTPSLTINGGQLQHTDKPEQHAKISVGSAHTQFNLTHLFSEEPVWQELTIEETNINAHVDNEGQPDWSYLITSEDNPAPTNKQEALPIPAIRRVQLNNLQLSFSNEPLGQTVNLTLSASGSTTDSERLTDIEINGTINNLDTVITATASPLLLINQADEAIQTQVNARLGSTNLTLNGSISNWRDAPIPNMAFSVSGPGLEDVEKASGIALPTLPPFSMNSQVLKDGAEWVLKRFQGELGDSDIEGDIRVNPETSPPLLYANVISKSLDLDDLAGFVGGQPDPNETATAEQREEASASNKDGKLLPSESFDLRPVTGLINGAVEYRAQSVRSPVWPIDSLDLRAEINGSSVSISPLTVGLASGTVAGNAALDLSERPMRSEWDINIKQVSLKDVLSSIGIDDDSFGKLGGEAKFWATGDSVAELASTANGGLFLLMTEGRLDALLAELMGLDVTESLILLIDPEKTRTDINCAFIDVLSTQGVVEISTLVMDTDDAVVLGEGRVNLGNESLNVIVEPHPKDTSIIAAQTAARIQGSFTDLSVTPGQTLYARAAAAVVLASIASPAAALLPFVDAGSGEDSEYCTGMVTALDDAR